MSSSDELMKRIFSGLEVENAKNSPKEEACRFDCSSKFSTLDNLNEDVHLLDSNVMTLGAKVEASGQALTDLRFHYHNLRNDNQRVKGDIEQIKETVRGQGERLDDIDEKLEMLYALPPIIGDNQAKIAKLEERTNGLDARLGDEKRQREESDSSLQGWLAIGGIFAVLWLLSRQRPAETQSSPQLTPPVRQAEVAARAYIAAKERMRGKFRSVDGRWYK